LIAKVVEVRLRFLVILLLTFLLIGKWDTIRNYWERYTRPAAAAGQLPADKEFFCPMHPAVIRHSLAPDGSVPKCPICGMPLSLRTRGRAEPLPEGVTARVQLSPERIALAGIATAEVVYRPMSKRIRTVAAVAYDEGRLSRVVSRTSGYVEKLYVDKTFVQVKAGDPLIEIYSPELYSTAQELLLAAKSSVDKELAESARRRLKLFGVADRDVDAMLSSGVVMPRLLLRSTQSGYVTAKNVVAGARVEDGMTLLEIADLSDVWIEADLYETDAAFIHGGQTIRATVEGLPHRVFTGKVALVYPQLDAATRTNRVRFAVSNPGGELRPGMYAAVEVNVALREIEPFKTLLAKGPPAGESLLRPAAPATPGAEDEVLAVPQTAVIDTGAKQIVYVESQPGVFDGVEVQLGPRDGEFYAVAAGLRAGQRVAAAGAFLIDAETRLNPAAASAYFGAAGGPQHPTAGKSDPSP
jgi:Cu(I)/Ag(I) efflux system membrane fusion protein